MDCEESVGVGDMALSFFVCIVEQISLARFVCICQRATARTILLIRGIGRGVHISDTFKFASAACAGKKDAAELIKEYASCGAFGIRHMISTFLFQLGSGMFL